MTNHGARPKDAEPKFAPGARVIWHRANGKEYPATVNSADWFRRTREPWQYSITLDRNAATARMSHLLRFPPESQLSAEEEPRVLDGSFDVTRSVRAGVTRPTAADFERKLRAKS